MTKELDIWECQTKIEQIRRTFAPKLSDTEFGLFVGLGKATGLNPFLREIWAVPFGGSAQIFIGRDGYRKGAQRHKEYDYHQVDAVYSNDNFEVNNGNVNHAYKIGNRGELIGAYCIVQRKSASKHIFHFVELREYIKYTGVWKDKPATMIKKVAEAQGLRMAFQDLFAGTYSEDEAWDETQVKPIKNITPDQPIKLQEEKKPTIDQVIALSEIVATKATTEQILELKERSESVLTEQQIKDGFEYLKRTSYDDLTKNDFDIFNRYIDRKEREKNA